MSNPTSQAMTASTPAGLRSADGIARTLLAVASFGLILLLSAWSMPLVVWREFDNLYFNADSSLVYSNMTDFASNHYRTGMHPAFSLVMAPLVWLLQASTPLSAEWSVRVLLALNASLWVGLLFALLRRLSLSRLDASLVGALALVSSGTVFWNTIPETFPFGGTTLLFMLWLVSRGMDGSRWLVAGNVAAMSMTMTNWMVAFYGTMQLLWGRWRLAFRVFVASGLGILFIGIVSKLVFPSAGYTGDFRRYLNWIRLPRPADWPSIFGHSVVMPEPVYRLAGSGALEVVVEPASLASGSPAGPFALVLWWALLIAGTAMAWRSRSLPLTRVLGLTLLSQVGLHSFFSDGPFLFAAHYTPLLLLIAAHALLLRRSQLVVRGAFGLAIGLVAFNNLTVFASLTDRFATEVLPWLHENGSLMSEPEPPQEPSSTPEPQ